DVLEIGTERRLVFLVPKGPELRALRKDPVVAMSVEDPAHGSRWLQSQGVVEEYDDPALVKRVAEGLKQRYDLALGYLALGLGDGSRKGREQGYVVGTIAHQRVTSRPRESEASKQFAESMSNRQMP